MFRIRVLAVLVCFGFVVSAGDLSAVPILQVDMNKDGGIATLGSPAGWLQWNNSEISGESASKSFGDITVSISGNGGLKCGVYDWEGGSYVPSSGELRSMVQDFLYAHDGVNIRIDMVREGLKANQPYEMTTWHNVGFPLDGQPNRIDIIVGGETVAENLEMSLNVDSSDDAASATFLVLPDSSGRVDLTFAAAGAGGGLDGWGNSNVAIGGFELVESIDAPTIQFASRASGDFEGAGPATIVVKLIKGEAGASYTVDYSVVGGSATGGVDYVLDPGTVTFGPGQTSATIDISIANDGVDEEDETIVVALSNPGAGAQLGVAPEHTYTIKDPRPHVSFAQEESEGSEDVDPVVIEVTLSTPVAEVVRVDYSVVGGSATAGDDYVALSGTLVFNPGQTSKNISINILTDDVEESDETIAVGLSNLRGHAVLGPYTEHTYTLTEAPGVQWDGMTWYFSQFPVRLSVNPGGELVWSNPWPPDQITVQLPAMRFSEPGDVAEVTYLYKGEGSELSSAFGTGDIRIALLDSNGQGHVDADGHGYNNPIWCGYMGYKVNISPHASTSRYSGRFAKREEPWCDVCGSIVQKNQGCWEGQDTQPKIDGFGLGGGQWSLLSLRLERTSGSGVVFTVDLNGTTYRFEDDDPANQPQKIDAMAMYFPNDRPFTSIMFKIPEGPKPSRPNPADGSGGASSNVVLRWKAGMSAVSQDVYFGDSFAAVSGATRGSSEFMGNQVEERYSPDCLEMGGTYYWRVDDVTSGGTVKGDVWSFSTKACATMEGFESYADADALSASWSPGGGAWADVSATERHAGVQSLELQYYNRDGPTYSDVSRTFDSTQDWSGHESVGLYFKGLPSNQDELTYMTVEDSSGGGATVEYGGSRSDLRNSNWQLWTVGLEQFAGVDMRSVQRVAISVGNPNGPTSSAVGMLYIDDFGLCGGGCAAAGCSCMGDLNEDAQVDLDDLQAVAGILLDAGSPFIVLVEAGHCGDLNEDGQVDLDDLQLVAGVLLDAGSPFIVQCD